MKTRIGTEVAHVTRDSDTIFKVKVKGQLAGAAALWRPTAQLVIIVIIIVAPCLFNAPASDSSSSGFVSGRGDNDALRAEWRSRSAHPLACDRQRGAVKRQRCSIVDGDYVFHGSCKNDTVSGLIV